MKIALVETKVSKTNFKREFGDEFEFEQFQLCSDPTIKKVLKKDVDIVLDVDAYDRIILVGSEALKYYTKVSAISTCTGTLIDGKFLPIINPSMLIFKPEMKNTWDRSKSNVIDYINGSLEDTIVTDDIASGIQDTEKLIE